MVKKGETLLKVAELISEYKYSDGISAEKVKKELIAIRDYINKVFEHNRMRMPASVASKKEEA